MISNSIFLCAELLKMRICKTLELCLELSSLLSLKYSWSIEESQSINKYEAFKFQVWKQRCARMIPTWMSNRSSPQVDHLSLYDSTEISTEKKEELALILPWKSPHSNHKVSKISSCSSIYVEREREREREREGGERERDVLAGLCVCCSEKSSMLLTKPI